MATILIIEDEVVLGKSIARYLTKAGLTCVVATTAEAGLKRFEEITPDLVLLDIRLHGMDGLEALRHMMTLRPEVRVVVMTAYGTIETAVQAMKTGACDYICKPFDLEALREVIESALDHLPASQRLAASAPPLTMIGDCPSMQAILKLIERFAQIVPREGGDLPTILILGETGTGKDLAARAIHAKSPFASGPFVEVNCTALPKELIEAELFGYEKGAFTGATEAKRGLFEAAEGGTLFLDEVGDLSLEAQAKLLRVIEYKTVRPIGSLHARKVHMRIIAATNRDLEALTRKQVFRLDLFYRLNVLRLELPPLCARGDDIVSLSKYVLQMLAQKYTMPVKQLAPEAIQALRQYTWPGNVRELAHVMERAVLLNDQAVVEAECLGLPHAEPAQPDNKPAHGSMCLPEMEQQLIERALVSTKGNVSEAARRLGIGREALRYRLQKYDIPAMRLG
ncbi:MAG: hypothetical protein ETSY1_01390 [Candidatus Entotheonella factor]|uniref:Sigma-54-dependent Fis family transcriptional regulator n=1 Tax=Entotheonella factor TaxID=1429438 RepID=W4LYT8_ENTF1|nr:sigma-54 dependent transcriptional regulator [Candidatus Entotheonella palauensis]ETX03068.1 MAG: hypothetical protein ETSY1_01390 [Candidatus Entotheonella factor]